MSQESPSPPRCPNPDCGSHQFGYVGQGEFKAWDGKDASAHGLDEPIPAGRIRVVFCTVCRQALNAVCGSTS